MKLTRASLACAIAAAPFILAWGAHGQESHRPGCVIRHDNGRPYLFCDKEEEEKHRQPATAPKMAPPAAKYETVAPAPPPAPTATAPAETAPAAPAPRTAPTNAGRVGGSSSGPGRPPTGGTQYRYQYQRQSPAAAPSAGPRQNARVRAVRALIEPAEMPPRELAGYGIVAFTTRPLPHDIERYKAVCEAYKATLMAQDELPPDTPLSEQMITYWPIGKKNTPEAQRADCTHLVTNYALRLGLDAIQDADRQKEGLASRRGPFLIAWAPSESRFKPDAVVLVMDLSALDGQRSFAEVFQDWRQKITDNPDLWQRGGFDIESVRRIIRDTFDRYGDGLLRLITKS
ncbi:MAG: hypothetical protein WBW74_25865 [Xanthobacteraceae bacterium]